MLVDSDTGTRTVRLVSFIKQFRLLLAGYGNGKTVSIRVDNTGSMPTTYTLSHETALGELYSNDIPSQVRARFCDHLDCSSSRHDAGADSRDLF